jgi:hypothetical protein
MDYLTSNTQLGQYLDTLELSLSAYKQIRQKADCLMSQTVEAWMFAPCKIDNGKLIPLEYVEKPLSPNTDEVWDKWTEYQEEKEKCFFLGFSNVSQNNDFLFVTYNKKTYWIPIDYKIEDLVDDDFGEILITPAFKKQIGL